MVSEHGNTRVSDDELIAAIKDIDEPVASTAEIAQTFSMTRTGVAKRLNSLFDSGSVCRKSVGSGYVWWIEGHSAP